MSLVLFLLLSNKHKAEVCEPWGTMKAFPASHTQKIFLKDFSVYYIFKY